MKDALIHALVAVVSLFIAIINPFWCALIIGLYWLLRELAQANASHLDLAIYSMRSWSWHKHLEWLLPLAVVVVVGVILSAPAGAHSWYEPKCCSGKDCEPIPFEAVTETKDGYMVQYRSSQGYDVKALVPREKAREGHDGQFHGCAIGRALVCLYKPAPSI